MKLIKTTGGAVRTKLSFIAGLVALLAALCAPPLQAETVRTEHLESELVANDDAIPDKGDLWVAIRHKPTEGWHTYWQNPGGAGRATQINWILPDGVTAGPIQWPAPSTLKTLGVVNYGYAKETFLLVKLSKAGGLHQGTLPLKAIVDFTVCSETLCVPERAELSLDLAVADSAPGTKLKRALKAIPKPLATVAAYQAVNGELRLGFVAPLAGNDELSEARNDFIQPAGAYFFPEPEGLFDPDAPQAIDLGSHGFSIGLKTKEGFADWAKTKKPLNGIIKFPSGEAYQISLKPEALPAGTSGLGSPAQPRADMGFFGVALAMILAFAGGIILNLMPCVFPVLSMKILSLAKAGQDTRAAQIESLLYGAGAVASFIVLSLILNLATATGSAIGWGFQLQSPHVTAALALLMLLVGFNMLGLFEVGLKLQSFGGEVLSKWGLDRVGPMVSAFMTGVLAVLVAAPCTAPFMATAIGVALSQGGLISFLIFLSLGLGFVAPIIGLTFLIARIPALAAHMPKPGMWMEWLRRILAIPMFGAALWLMWVFAQQVTGGIWLLGLGILFIIAAILLPKVMARFPNLSLPAYSQALAVFLGVSLMVLGADMPKIKPTTAVTVSGEGLKGEHFDLERLTALRAQGKPVFVDLTAAWCVTCKVNEKLVFATPEFQKAIKDTGTVYVVGDWTNQDAGITRYLALYGRSGVPLYVYYPPNNGKPVVLGQLLKTEDTVKLIKGGA